MDTSRRNLAPGAESRSPASDAETPGGGVPPSRLTTRRRALRWLIRLGYGAFAVAFALPALALRSLTQATRDVAPGDVLVYAASTPGAPVGQPVKAADLREGTGVQVFPRDKEDNQNNLVELVRIAAGEGAEGLVAYSAICTHLGCSVYAALNRDGNIACPCHASVFDPRADAKVLGGPAPRPLPSLPVTVDGDGNVVVNGSFSGPIGPQ